MNSLAAFYQGNHTLELKPNQVQTLRVDQARVRIAYCGICGSDIHIYHGDMDERVRLNRIIGHEISGVVEEVGEGVSHLKPGQKVTLRPPESCITCPSCKAGHHHTCHQLNCIDLGSDGAMQEVLNLPANLLYPLPDSLPLNHAALIEPVAIACHSVRLSDLNPGEHVVVIGILTALTSKADGGNVVVIEINPHRIEMAKKLGFTVIDPRESKDSDVTAEVMKITGDEGATVIFEVSGSKSGAELMTKIAASRARIMMVAIHPHPQPVDLFQVFRRELLITGTRIQEPEDFTQAIELVVDKKIPIDTLITDIHPLKKVPSVFDGLDKNPTSLKTLIKMG